MLEEKTARKRRHIGSRGRLEGNFKIGVRSKRILLLSVETSEVNKELDLGFC